MTKAENHTGDLNAFGGDNYTYSKDLTTRLDGFTKPFSQEYINEIVLWKVGRYVDVTGDLREQLDEVRNLKPDEENKAEALIRSLLELKGVQIAMASTFLRFANPEVFQIIDSHAYRAVYGGDLEYALKGKGDDVALYLEYLRELRRICLLKLIPFNEADRILFEFDKAKNPPLKETKEAAQNAWKSPT